MFFEFTLRIESADKKIGCRDKRQCGIGKNKHGDQQLLGPEQLLSAGSSHGAPLDGTWYLREVKDPEVRFGMPLGVAGKGARNCLGAGYAKVVDVIGPGGAGEIGVDHAPGEVGTVPGHAIEVILVGSRIKKINQTAVLLDR